MTLVHRRCARVLARTAFVSAHVLLAACSSGGALQSGAAAADGSPGACSMPGAASTGPADTHCELADGGRIAQPTDFAACRASPSSSSAAPIADDASAPPCYEGGDFGAPLYGTSGSDDDCKYDVTWSSSPATFCVGTAVTLTATVTKRTDGTPVTGAATIVEAITSDCLHASSSRPESSEATPGTYTIGPLVFDRSGTWLLRFHFFEGYEGGACSDTEPDSPHGHAAFWVTLP